MNKKINWLKIYAIFITVCALVIAAGFCMVFHHAGYDERLLYKLGVKQQEIVIDCDADVVFFGDSLTHNGNFQAYFEDKKICNMGIGGDSLNGMIDRIPDIVQYTPEKVFVLGGINGLRDNKVEDSIVVYSELIDRLLVSLPEAEIYIQSVLPISESKESKICHNSTIREFNCELEKLALEKELSFINLYPLYELDGELNPKFTDDGLHIYAESYARWVDAIAEYVK